MTPHIAEINNLFELIREIKNIEEDIITISKIIQKTEFLNYRKEIKTFILFLSKMNMEYSNKIKIMEILLDNIFHKIKNNISKKKKEELTLSQISSKINDYLAYIMSYKLIYLSNNNNENIKDDFLFHLKHEIINRLHLLVNYFGIKFLRIADVNIYTYQEIKFFTIEELCDYYNETIEMIQTKLNKIKKLFSTYFDIVNIIKDMKTQNTELEKEIIIFEEDENI